MCHLQWNAVLCRALRFDHDAKLSDFVCAFPILHDQIGDDRQN